MPTEPSTARHCTGNCRRPTPAQAHCTACHRTFGGASGFDAHRRDGRCTDPRQLGMAVDRGVWRTPMTDKARQRLRERACA